jgi:hypothetical protein
MQALRRNRKCSDAGVNRTLTVRPQTRPNRNHKCCCTLTTPRAARCRRERGRWELQVNSIIYLVGLIVIVLAILSFVGVR